MQRERLFIILWSAIVVVAIGLMVLLYVSLLPFFRYIGIGATVVVFIGMSCLVVLVVSWTRNRVLIWNAEVHHRRLMSRVIAYGDLVAMPMVDGSIRVLSAEHERAKVPLPDTHIHQQQQLPAPKKPDHSEVIIQAYKDGMSLRATEKWLKELGVQTNYSEVQKIVAAYKEANGIT